MDGHKSQETIRKHTPADAEAINRFQRPPFNTIISYRKTTSGLSATVVVDIGPARDTPAIPPGSLIVD